MRTNAQTLTNVDILAPSRDQADALFRDACQAVEGTEAKAFNGTRSMVVGDLRLRFRSAPEVATSATLFGYPARLVLTIDGRDVDVTDGIEQSPQRTPIVSTGAVLDTIQAALKGN